MSQDWLAYLKSSTCLTFAGFSAGSGHQEGKVSGCLTGLTCLRIEGFRELSSNLASSWLAMDLTLFWFPPSLMPSWLEPKLWLEKAEGCKAQISALVVVSGTQISWGRPGGSRQGQFLKKDTLYGLRKWGRHSRQCSMETMVGHGSPKVGTARLASQTVFEFWLLWRFLICKMGAVTHPRVTVAKTKYNNEMMNRTVSKPITWLTGGEE